MNFKSLIESSKNKELDNFISARVKLVKKLVAKTGGFTSSQYRDPRVAEVFELIRKAEDKAIEIFDDWDI